MLPIEFKRKDESLFSFPTPPSAKKSRSRVRQKLTILKKAMTTKEICGWSSKDGKPIGGGSRLLCRKPKLSGAMDPGKSAKYMGKDLRVVRLGVTD